VFKLYVPTAAFVHYTYFPFLKVLLDFFEGDWGGKGIMVFCFVFDFVKATEYLTATFEIKKKGGQGRCYETPGSEYMCTPNHHRRRPMIRESS